jgi:tetratricopeptide (TPR) repeat protein
VSELYTATGNWVKAEPLLTLILELEARNESGGDTAGSRLAQVHFHRGRALENLLKTDEALQAYEKAFELNPDDTETLKALGRMLYASDELERAESMVLTVIERIEDGAEENELVTLYRTLGDIAFRRGNDKDARSYLEKTLAIKPGDSAALDNLIELCTEQGYWDGVIQYATELLEIKDDSLQKFELQLRIGDVFLKHLEQSHDAIQAYRRALDFQPDSKAAHLKIFQVLVDAESYGEAVEILSRLIELETDAQRKASYSGAIADIYRDKLGNWELAVDFFNVSLDNNPNQLKAFRAIAEILTEQKDAKALEKNYRYMLKRVQDDDSQEALQFKLCYDLGEIYRSRLQEMEKARAYFEAALNIRPGNLKTLGILTQLYELENETDKAISMVRGMLVQQPGELGHYRTLKRLFLEAGDRDAAWVACAVLTLLGQADDAERVYHEEHASPDTVTELTGISGDIWAKYLTSRGEDLLLGQIFQTLYQGLGENLARKTVKELGLKKKDEVDLTKRELFAHVFNNVADVLAINPRPTVYHTGRSPGMHIEETVPPVIVIGDELRKGKTERELSFVLAKVMTYFHPMHVAICVAPPESLQALFAAAATLFVPDYEVGEAGKAEGFQALRAVLDGLPTQLRVTLQQRVEEFVGTGQSPNINRWLNQVELTANHAGLLMCNSVVAAGQMLQAESYRTLFTAPSRLTVRDKLVDLATYALSEEYLSLRREAGIALE